MYYPTQTGNALSAIGGGGSATTTATTAQSPLPPASSELNSILQPYANNPSVAAAVAAAYMLQDGVGMGGNPYFLPENVDQGYFASQPNSGFGEPAGSFRSASKRGGAGNGGRNGGGNGSRGAGGKAGGGGMRGHMNGNAMHGYSPEDMYNFRQLPGSEKLQQFRADTMRNVSMAWRLGDIVGFAVEFAKDQEGSRFIQGAVDRATAE
uniref:Uncharacterized protein n=1 Tax=Lygus hesperus TaxID=30085 RepID=A0A0A9XAB1_LYGHE